MSKPPNIWILGSGPAAWSLAAAAVQLGLQVGLVAPDPRGPWSANYGVWAEDWEGAGLPNTLDRRWSSAAVVFKGQTARFERSYASVNNTALSHELQSRADGVRVVCGSVVHTDGRTVQLQDGTTLSAEVVVDATGANSAFLERTGDSTGATQTAWGIDAEVKGWTGSPSEAVFMDFSGPEHQVGSFLYALPHSEDRVFFEETSLAASPALSLSELESRLYARLEQRGIVVKHIHATERCVIPMDPRLPTTNQALVGFGAAASLVHPATGYTLLHTLKRAPAVASAIAEGLSTPGGSPARAQALAWKAVWPGGSRTTNRLHRFGLRALLTLSDAQQRSFFERFFELPEHRWSAYLNPDAPLRDLSAAMLHLFANADAPLRWRLATAGLAASPRTPERPALSGGSA